MLCGPRGAGLAKHGASAPEGLTGPGQWQPVSRFTRMLDVGMETRCATDNMCGPQSMEELLCLFGGTIVKLGIVV